MSMATIDELETARGGWALDVRCGVNRCTEEAQFRGFVLSQAADAATKAGWQVDHGELVRHDRVEVCPAHSERHRLVEGQIVDTYCEWCGAHCQGDCADILDDDSEDD